MALLALDTEAANHEELVDRLADTLLKIEAEEFEFLRNGLRPHCDGLRYRFWQVARDSQTAKSKRLRASCALASFDPKSADWHEIAGDVVGQVLSENRLVASIWMRNLGPVREILRPHLQTAFDDDVSPANRQMAAALIADLFWDDASLMGQLILRAEPKQLAELMSGLAPADDAPKNPGVIELLVAEVPTPGQKITKPNFSRANAIIGLFRLGRPEFLLEHLDNHTIPGIRTELIHRLGPAGVDANWLDKQITRLCETSESPGLTALILALGGYTLTELSASSRQSMLPKLSRLAREHPDAAIHSALDWLIRTWKMEDLLSSETDETDSAARRWRVNSRGQILAWVRPGEPFAMGSSAELRQRFVEQHQPADKEVQHLRRIGRAFEIGTREVTVAEFAAFEKVRLQRLRAKLEVARRQEDDRSIAEVEAVIERFEGKISNRQGEPQDDRPVTEIKWIDAVTYCRWLSEQDGIAEDQQCYPPLAALDRFEVEKLPPDLPADFLERTGYRLPTEAEWEFACRAGSTTVWPMGEDSEHLPKYAWFNSNSPQANCQPVARLKPNDFGLFDMLGNASEWCQDWFNDYPSRVSVSC